MAVPDKGLMTEFPDRSSNVVTLYPFRPRIWFSHRDVTTVSVVSCRSAQVLDTRHIETWSYDVQMMKASWDDKLQC